MRREFLEWRKSRLTELWKCWDATVRDATPAARFIPNGPPDLKEAGELADVQFADHQARRGVMPPWANGRRAKEYRSVKGPLREIIPVGPLPVRIRIAAGERVKAGHLLTAGMAAEIRESDDVVAVTVPSVEVHEVIAIDL